MTIADLHREAEPKKLRIGFRRRRLTNLPRPRLWVLSMAKAALPTPRSGIRTSHTRNWSARRRAFALTARARAMLAHAQLRRQEWLKRVSQGAPLKAWARIGIDPGPGRRGFAQPSRRAESRTARSRSDSDTGDVPAALRPFLELLAKILAEAALKDPRLENLERLNVVDFRG